MDKKKNIEEMQNMDGIAMIQDLHFRYMMGVEKLKDIIYFMHYC